MRKWPIVFIFGLLFFTSGAITFAAISPEVKVQLGLKDCYKKRCWFPLIITVSHEAETTLPCQAVASLEDFSPGAGTVFRLRTFSRQFQLKGGGRKQEIILPVITSPSADRLTLTIQDIATGLPFYNKSFDLEPTGRKTALILSQQPSQFDILGSLWTDIKTVFIAPASLPHSGHLYDSFDLLILDDVSLLSIEADAWEAVLDWVAGGGKLIFTEECLKKNAALPVFQSLWPVKIKSGFEIKHPRRLIQFLRLKDVSLNLLSGTEAILPEGDVFLAEDGYTLIGKRALGLGALMLLTFNPENLSVSPPEKSYLVRQTVWNWVLKKDYGGDPVCWKRDYTIPHSARVEYLNKYIIIYLVIIVFIILGPVNYLLLKRFDKREYLLVVIPVIAIIFGIIPYLIGRHLRGSEATLKVVGVEFGKGGESRAISRTYLGLLSADTRQYRLGVEEKGAWPRDKVETDYAFKEKRAVGRFPIQIEFREKETVISNLKMALWAMRFFRLDTFTRYPGALDYEIDLKGNSLEGTFSNRLDCDLKDAYLIHRYQHIYLGDLKKGESSSWSLSLPEATPDISEVGSPSVPACRSYGSIFSRIIWHQEKFISDELKILDDVFDNFSAQFENPVLLARRPHPSGRFNLNRPAWKEECDSFVFFALPLRLDALDIPFGLSRRVVRGGGSPFAMRVSNKESIVVEYDLPFHVQEPVITEAISLRFETHLRRSDKKPSPLFTFEAYNWEKEKWESIGNTREEKKVFKFPHPERFVFYPEGLIRVKVGLSPEGKEKPLRRGIRSVVFDGFFPSWAQIRCLDISYRGRREDE